MKIKNITAPGEKKRSRGKGYTMGLQVWYGIERHEGSWVKDKDTSEVDVRCHTEYIRAK